MDRPDMYEQFKNKMLPPEIQTHCESAAEHHSNYGTENEDEKNTGLLPDSSLLKISKRLERYRG